jgi:hypothetical protein
LAVVGKLVQGLCAAFDGAEFQDRIACGDRREPARHRDLRLSLALGKRDRGAEGVGVGFAVAAEIIDKPLRLHDFAIDDPCGIVRAVRSMHDVAPLSAGLHDHGMNRVGEAVRAPPVRDVLGIGPGFPHQLARRIDGARDDDRRFAGGGDGSTFFGHVFFLSLAAF